MKIPNFRIGCIKFYFVLAIGIWILTGCAKATIEHHNPDGSKSVVTVPFFYQYNEQEKVLRSDEHLVNASSVALQKIAEKSPEIISEIGKKMVEQNAKATDQ